MYMSALKPLLLAEDNKKIIETVLPNLVAFRAIRQGKDIIVRKRADNKKDQEKQERLAKTGQINLINLQGTQQAASLTADASAKQSTSKNASPVRGGSP